MNNTINPITPNYNNVSFRKRYLQTVWKEKINNKEIIRSLPIEIEDALRKNEVLQKFIEAGNPKTWFGKFLDLFKRDEILLVKFNQDINIFLDSVEFIFGKKSSKMVNRICVDNNIFLDSVEFIFGKKGSKMVNTDRICVDNAELKTHQIKPGEDIHRVASLILAKQVERITDIKSKVYKVQLSYSDLQKPSLEINSDLYYTEELPMPLQRLKQKSDWQKAKEADTPYTRTCTGYAKIKRKNEKNE